MSTDMHLELRTGEVRSIRVYSEPSHRLLGAFVNNSAGKPEDQPWYRGYGFMRGDRVMQTPLTVGSKATLQAKGPAETDQTLTLVVDAVWPTENAYRERVMTVQTNVKDYSFTLTRYSTLGQVCCDGECGKHCTLCRGDIYRCCYTTGCLWCGEAQADCEQGQCPNCN